MRFFSAFLLAAKIASLPVQATKSGVFSAAYLEKYCSLAQSEIANAELIPDIKHYANLSNFIDSDAYPYDGNVDLPFTVTQYVGFSSAGSVSKSHYAQTVLCKMKSWDALDYYYPGSASEGSNCTTVSRKIANDVIEQIKKENPRVTIPPIVYDYWMTYTGSEWTDDSPTVTAYISKKDGMLHLVGKELYVSRTNKFPFIGPNKKGVDYCQTIAPEYLRLIILKRVVPPTCAPPPTWAYRQLIPIPLKKWNCENPSSEAAEFQS